MRHVKNIAGKNLAVRTFLFGYALTSPIFLKLVTKAYNGKWYLGSSTMKASELQPKFCLEVGLPWSTNPFMNIVLAF